MNRQVEQIRAEIDFEQELYKAFGHVKDFTLCLKIAKWFYNMSRNHQEPVSEDLDIAIGEYCSNPDNFITYIDVAFAYRSEQKDDIPLIIKAIKFGAQWQQQQMMKEATDVTVHVDAGGYPYIPQMELYDYDKDIPLAKEGDKYKVILIKQD